MTWVACTVYTAVWLPLLPAAVLVTLNVVPIGPVVLLTDLDGAGAWLPWLLLAAGGGATFVAVVVVHPAADAPAIAMAAMPTAAYFFR